jgi:hypothetical protein
VHGPAVAPPVRDMGRGAKPHDVSGSRCPRPAIGPPAHGPGATTTVTGAALRRFGLIGRRRTPEERIVSTPAARCVGKGVIRRGSRRHRGPRRPIAKSA